MIDPYTTWAGRALIAGIIIFYGVVIYALA